MKSDTQQHSIPAIANSAAAKWSYISLIYSLFYFFALYAGWNNYTEQEVVLVFIGYAGFILLYIKCIRTSGNEALIPVAGLIALATIIATFHVGANALFGYAAFLASYYFRSTVSWLFLLVNLLLQLAVAITFEKLHIYFLGPSVAVTVSLFFYGLFSQKECIFQMVEKEKNQQIEQLAAIAERERIARDMHDLLGHTLSSLALKSELAEKLIERGEAEKAQVEIKQVAELSRTTLSEVRAAVTGLKQKGLTPTLEKLCEQLRALGFKTQSNLTIAKMDAKTESTLIMLCKEWITNILRHSEGNAVSIAIEQRGDRIHLNISDNGSVTEIKAGNGIDGMKTRIQELRGEFALHIDKGVKLDVTLPVKV